MKLCDETWITRRAARDRRARRGAPPAARCGPVVLRRRSARAAPRAPRASRARRRCGWPSERLRSTSRRLTVDGHERRVEGPRQRPRHARARRDRSRGGSRAARAARRKSGRYRAGIRLPPCSQVTRKASVAHDRAAHQCSSGRLAEHLARAFAPLVAQRREVGVALVEAAPPAAPRGCPARSRSGRSACRPTGCCASSSRTTPARTSWRPASGVDRVITRSMIGLPYLVSPVWKNGVSIAGLDEVALGVDAEQPHRLAADLSADDERRVEADLVRPRRYSPSRRSMSRIASATSIATSNIVRAFHRLATSSPARAALVQHADHRLRSGEVAGAQQHDDAVAAALEHRHLAELGDVVHAGVRARVRREDDATRRASRRCSRSCGARHGEAPSCW